MSLPEEPRAEALKSLNSRADALEARTTRTVPDYGSKAQGMAWSLLAQLLGGVFVGLALGLVADGVLHTAPWGIITGVLLGFGLSVFLAYRLAKRLTEQASREFGPPRDLPDDEDED
ncbi:MAG: AtpZ/AtpI family protein [Caulobacteraceae bacterium]|nr:AtpZ/AtpI family protein [Caulobacteraceae bacterium]